MSEVKKVSLLPFVDSVSASDYLLVYTSEGPKRLHKNAVFVKRPRVTDLNQAVSTGYYPISGVNVLDHTPDNILYGVLLVFDDHTSFDAEFVQILIGLSPVCAMYLRKKGTSSGWGPWNKVTASSSWSNSRGGVNINTSISYAILQKGGLRDERNERTYQRPVEKQDAGCDGVPRLLSRHKRGLSIWFLCSRIFDHKRQTDLSVLRSFDCLERRRLQSSNHCVYAGYILKDTRWQPSLVILALVRKNLLRERRAAA